MHDVHTHRFDNGLTLHVAPGHTAPVVAVQALEAVRDPEDAAFAGDDLCDAAGSMIPSCTCTLGLAGSGRALPKLPRYSFFACHGRSPSRSCSGNSFGSAAAL